MGARHRRAGADLLPALKSNQYPNLPKGSLSCTPIGGGIGQSRTLMMLPRKARLGEVTVSVWPKILKELYAKRDIHVLE